MTLNEILEEESCLEEDLKQGKKIVALERKLNKLKEKNNAYNPKNDKEKEEKSNLKKSISKLEEILKFIKGLNDAEPETEEEEKKLKKQLKEYIKNYKKVASDLTDSKTVSYLKGMGGGAMAGLLLGGIVSVLNTNGFIRLGGPATLLIGLFNKIFNKIALPNADSMEDFDDAIGREKVINALGGIELGTGLAIGSGVGRVQRRKETREKFGLDEEVLDEGIRFFKASKVIDKATKIIIKEREKGEHNDLTDKKFDECLDKLGEFKDMFAKMEYKYSKEDDKEKKQELKDEYNKKVEAMGDFYKNLKSRIRKDKAKKILGAAAVGGLVGLIVSSLLGSTGIEIDSAAENVPDIEIPDEDNLLGVINGVPKLREIRTSVKTDIFDY